MTVQRVEQMYDALHSAGWKCRQGQHGGTIERWDRGNESVVLEIGLGGVLYFPLSKELALARIARPDAHATVIFPADDE
jgi:hypothetical protein